MTNKEASKALIMYAPKDNNAISITLREAMKMGADALDNLKIGYWKYDEELSDWYDTTYECSCCKRTIITPIELSNNVYKNYPYCHCGAKMIKP